VAKAKTTQEGATIQVSAATLEQLAAVAKLFGIGSLDETLAAVVDRFHAAHLKVEGRLPFGWHLRDDLTLADLEAYYAARATEDEPVSAWHMRGREIRAAVTAGWFDEPAGLTADDVARLRPAQVPAIKAAIDELYIRLTTADPNW
jgi:hypothetical protein